jgi:hypothetical protein
LTTAKELRGNKTLTMTLRNSHLAPSHKVRAVDLLDSKLSEGYCQKLQSVQVLNPLNFYIYNLPRIHLDIPSKQDTSTYFLHSASKNIFS